MATDQGPASNNAEYFFGSTVGLEVHIPNSGLNPLPPSSAPFVDPNAGTSAANSPLQKTLTIGGGSVVFAVPA